MSWMAKLYETYEHAKANPQQDGAKLMPICHTVQTAHINIVIDGEGQFINARVLPAKTQIMLPATEKSAGRSSGEAPHPLQDKIQYVAGDYAKFGGTKKAYFEGYKALLEQWSVSQFGHRVLSAVLKYVSKASVVSDLIRVGVMHSENDVLLTKWEKEGEAPELFKVLPKEAGSLEQGSALVCWTVVIPGVNQADTWEDEALQQAWVDFDSSTGGQTGLCLIKGSNDILAVSHPAKIRHSGDKAKFVSSNDSSGFTYRGRFLKDEQANSISFDVTQKAHNALRWLLDRQGFRVGDQAYVTWAVSGKEVPAPQRDLLELLQSGNYVSPAEDHSKDLGQKFGNKLKAYLYGYIGENRLEADESIVIMGMDSATPGRMSVIYYREFRAKDFIGTLEKWHWDLAWPQRHKIKTETNGKVSERTIWAISAPSPYRLWTAIYGDVIKSNESLKKHTIERLMPCIVEGRQIPWDIVQNAIRRATNRVSYKSDETWLWEQNLGIACALYKGFCKRTKDESKYKEYDMALDTETTAKDYLYGRLLAVAENIESFALNLADENRTTTAERLMQRFAARPFSTWLTIELQIKPYVQRLQAKAPKFANKRLALLDEIHNQFEDGDYTSDKALSGEFLLGYHCQRTFLKSKKTTADGEEDQTNEQD